MDEQATQIIVANMNASSAILVALVAAISSIIGIIIGNLIGANSSRRVKITEIYFDRKYEAYRDFITNVQNHEMNEPGNISSLLPILETASLLSSPDTYQKLDSLLNVMSQISLLFFQDKHTLIDKSEYAKRLSLLLNEYQIKTKIVREALREELYQLGEKGYVHKKV